MTEKLPLFFKETIMAMLNLCLTVYIILCLSKCMKLLFFSRKKICVTALHKIFRPVTQNTLIFLFGRIVHTCSMGDRMFSGLFLKILN